MFLHGLHILKLTCLNDLRTLLKDIPIARVTYLKSNMSFDTNVLQRSVEKVANLKGPEDTLIIYLSSNSHELHSI